MKTLFNEPDRQELIGRLTALTAATPAKWGKMNAEQMVAHLIESMKLATGEVKAKPKKMIIRYPPLRELIIYLLPFPKGAPTVPELMRTGDAGTLERNRTELARLFHEIGSRTTQTKWPEHPAFGNLNRRAWGVLTYRHADHHLRQFGA
jgi:hypothetical protein